MRVLSVDDLPEMAEASKVVLKRCGVECEVAIGYEDAMSAVSEHGIDYFDVILVDFKMPVVNGLELAKMLRDAGYKKLIVGLSANPKKYPVEDQRAAGLNASIRKPLTKNHMYILEMDPDTVSLGDDAIIDSRGYEGVIDLDYTIGVVGDAEAAIEVADSFMNVLPEILNQLSDAFEKKNTEELRAIMHNVRGQTAYVGAPTIRKKSGEFHELLHSDAGDDKLKSSYDEVISSIHKFMDDYPECRERYDRTINRNC